MFWLYVAIVIVVLGVIFAVFAVLFDKGIIAKIKTKLHMKKLAKIDRKQDGIVNFIEYKKGRNRVGYAIMIILLMCFLFISIFPLFWLFVTSFKETKELNDLVNYSFWPQQFRFQKIIDVWKATKFGRYFLNSGIVVIGAVICSVVFNGLLAYGVSIVKPKGYKVVYILILASYMIPTVLSIVPLFAMIVKIGLIGSFVPLWLAFGANAYYFLLFKNYFDKIPHELVEAMKVDGAGNLTIFFKLIVPVSWPIIGTVAIFATTAAWSDFLLPKLVLQTNNNLFTVMVELYTLNDTLATNPGYTPDMLLMALVISIVPQLVLFFAFQKRITGGSMDGGLKE